jgi:hypothetical protein
VSGRGVSWFVTVAALASTALLGGCLTLPELARTEPIDSLRHEHNNYCGHGYHQSVTIDVAPSDFAGSDAWRGPLWEGEIRIKDPWRGDRPQPERPVPWYIPGGGSSEHADRQPPHEGTDGNPEAAGAYPHWPIHEERPETTGE